MSRFVVHVGLPKTGTSALQDAVFPKIAGITYLGPKGAAGLEARAAAAGRLITDALLLRPRETAAGDVRVTVRRAADWLRRQPGIALLSEEGLTSNARGRGAGYDPVPIRPAAIAALLPDAEIVLVLREPRAWIASMLLQRMWDRPTYWDGPTGQRPVAPQVYVDNDLALAARDDPNSIFGTMARFDRTLAAYRAAFPPARLHLLAYERLFGPGEGWRAIFGGLLGVPVDGPAPGRVNESSDEKRRDIAGRFPDLAGNARAIEEFVAAWRGLVPALQAHPAASAFLEAHAMPAWREAMGRGADAGRPESA